MLAPALTRLYARASPPPRATSSSSVLLPLLFFYSSLASRLFCLFLSLLSLSPAREAKASPSARRVRASESDAPVPFSLSCSRGEERSGYPLLRSTRECPSEGEKRTPKVAAERERPRRINMNTCMVKRLPHCYCCALTPSSWTVVFKENFVRSLRLLWGKRSHS